jgi:TusA-related sulfurtransferase
MSSLLERNKVQQVDEYHFKIDVGGLACPYPQLIVLGAIDGLSGGAELEITLDNPPSVRDIPPALEKRGHKVLDVSKTISSEWKITIQVR